MKKIKSENVTKKNFDIFIEGMYNYGLYHRIVKMVVDYLPADILASHVQTLAEARVYAEPVYTEIEKYMQYVAESLGKKYNIKPHLILAMTKEQFENFFVS